MHRIMIQAEVQGHANRNLSMPCDSARSTSPVRKTVRRKSVPRFFRRAAGRGWSYPSDPAPVFGPRGPQGREFLRECVAGLKDRRSNHARCLSKMR